MSSISLHRQLERAEQGGRRGVEGVCSRAVVGGERVESIDAAGKVVLLM